MKFVLYYSYEELLSIWLLHPHARYSSLVDRHRYHTNKSIVLQVSHFQEESAELHEAHDTICKTQTEELCTHSFSYTATRTSCFCFTILSLLHMVVEQEDFFFLLLIP